MIGMPCPNIFSSLTALNVPVEERIRMLEINMERWRWIPHDLGERYILVNLARFKLDVIEDNQQITRNHLKW